MEEIDLHGELHMNVQTEVLNFLFLNHHNLPVKIITGKSTKMREIVIDILKKNHYFYEVPAYNSGEIIVFN